MAKVPYGMRSFDATFRAIQRPALSPADRFALIRRAADAIAAEYPTGDLMGYVLNIMQAMADVAGNNRPDPDNVELLRDAATRYGL